MLELRAKKDYGDLVCRIWGYLREEVQQAQAEMIKVKQGNSGCMDL